MTFLVGEILAQRKIPVDLHFFTPENLERLRHKASGAALGLSCAACFEQPAGVFAGCGAVSVLLMSLSCQRQATAKADICRCRSFGGDNIRTLT